MYQCISSLKKKLKTKEEKKLDLLSFLYSISIIPFLSATIILMASFFHYGFNLYTILISVLYAALVVYLVPWVMKKINFIDEQLEQKKADKLVWLKQHVTEESLYRLELVYLMYKQINDVGDVDHAINTLEKKEMGEYMLDMVHYHIAHDSSWDKTFYHFLNFASYYNNTCTEVLEQNLKEMVEHYLSVYMNEEISPTMRQILDKKLNQNKKSSLSLSI